MPTLEDTIDFPVTTLSDLLEAEAKTGIAAAPDEEKYRRWAFLSTGAAGILALILVVVLITGAGGGGGGDDDGGKDVAKPPGTESATLSVAGVLGSEIKPGAIASVLTEDGVIASGGTVFKITQVGKEGSTLARKTIEIYVQKDEAVAIAQARAAQAKFTVVEGKQEKTPPTTVAPAPAEAPPAETPPASG